MQQSVLFTTGLSLTGAVQVHITSAGDRTYYMHFVKLSALAERTRYYYTVQSGTANSATSAVFNFRSGYSSGGHLAVTQMIEYLHFQLLRQLLRSTPFLYPPRESNLALLFYFIKLMELSYSVTWLSASNFCTRPRTLMYLLSCTAEGAGFSYSSLLSLTHRFLLICSLCSFSACWPSYLPLALCSH